MKLPQLARSTGIVALGTGVGQGAILLATPWLARIYTPAEFGLLGLIMTVGNIATAAACFRYDLAIPSAKSDTVRSLVKLAAICAVISALLIGLIYSILIAFKSQATNLPISVFAVMCCVLLIGFQQTTLSRLTHMQSYWKIAAIRILQGASFSLFALIGVVGLVWAYVLSLIAFAVTLKRPSAWLEKDQFTLFQIAKDNKQYPLVGLPGALVDVLGYSICIWVVTANYGASEAGQYTQIQRLVGAPMMLFSISLTQVLLRYTADFATDRLRLTALITKLQNMLLSVAVLLVCFTFIFGEVILAWLLGSQWRVDTQFVTLIVIAVAIRASVSPLSSVLVTLKRLDLGLKWQLTYFLSSIIVLGGSANWIDFSKFILVYAVHECVLYTYYLFVIRSSLHTLDK